jgi:hypothetical protein
MVAANDPAGEDTLGEVTRWFFDDYVSRYISVVSGTRQDGPEFILDYWGCPVHVSSPRSNRWLSEPRDVAGMFAETQARLRRAGYTHTAVLDSRLTVFHPGGAAIEVIWSRRAEQTEIERLAVHFQVVRTGEGWRAIAIQELDIAAQTLDQVWPVHRGQHRNHGFAAPYAGGIRTTGRLRSAALPSADQPRRLRGSARAAKE